MVETMKKIINVVFNVFKMVLLAASLASFICSFIFVENYIYIYLEIGGLYFHMYLAGFFHELGHIISLKKAKLRISQVKIFSFFYFQNTLHILDGFNLNSFVQHEKIVKEKHRYIYLQGSMYSFFLAIIFLIIGLTTSTILTMIVPIAVNAIASIANMVPYEGSDMYKYQNFKSEE